MIDRVRLAESQVGPNDQALVAAVAESYFKLLAVKDEYEVARLFSRRPAGVALSFTDKLHREFDPGFKTTYHFAPPLLTRPDANGRPRKIAVGGWFTPVLRLLAQLRRLRGTALDPFRWTAERRLDRELLQTFEADLAMIVDVLDGTNYEPCVAIARLPATIKGFGPVKEASARDALATRQYHLADLLARPIDPASRNGQAAVTREVEVA